MKHKQEIYAKQLYQELQNKFYARQNAISKILGLKKNNGSNSDIKISIEGAGVHWQCKVSKGTRKNIIHCFDVDFTNLEYKGPEYLTRFETNGHDEARGRTFDMIKTIEAVTIWLEGKTVEELYSKFSFIDEDKRRLEVIKTDIINLYPQILDSSVKDILEEKFSTLSSLWIKKESRSCRVYYYGYELHPRYLFNWDESLIFETSSSEIARMGLLIKRWVVDNAMPSALINEFPEINFGKLAEYYEQGNGIIGEFIMSWDSIEQFYDKINHEKKDEIFKLIRQMRSKGFDKTLRAGQSLYTLILSRSRRHGLKENQNSISFAFNYIKSTMEVGMQKGEKLLFDKIEYTDAIDGLLKSLEQEPID